jgi:hypothetical protein
MRRDRNAKVADMAVVLVEIAEAAGAGVEAEEAAGADAMVAADTAVEVVGGAIAIARKEIASQNISKRPRCFVAVFSAR